MTYPKKKVLISCRAPYIFNEIFKPIIEENYKKWNITLLISDVYVPDYLMETLHAFVALGKIRDFHFYPQLGKIRRGYQISELTFEKLKQNNLLGPLKDSVSHLKNQFFSSKQEFIKALRNFLPSDEFKLHGMEIVKLSKKTHLKTHQATKKVINIIEAQVIDLVVFMYDHNLINRYLIEIAKSRKIFSINVCPYAMSQVVQLYLNSNAESAQKYPGVLSEGKPIYFSPVIEKNGENRGGGIKRQFKKNLVIEAVESFD